MGMDCKEVGGLSAILMNEAAALTNVDPTISSKYNKAD